MMPVSELLITEAASRNVMRLTTVAPVFCSVAGLGLPARPGGECPNCIADRVGRGRRRAGPRGALGGGLLAIVFVESSGTSCRFRVQDVL